MEQLMEIYKIEAKKATCKAQAQKVLREQVQAQRVMAEQQAQVPQPTSPKQNPASFPSFEVEAAPTNPKVQEAVTTSYHKMTTALLPLTHVSNVSYAR
jgi:hypothetical protein